MQDIDVEEKTVDPETSLEVSVNDLMTADTPQVLDLLVRVFIQGCGNELFFFFLVKCGNELVLFE